MIAILQLRRKFTGIGSKGFCAVKLKRRFIGVELKEAYYRVAVRNLTNSARNAVDLFDVA